MYNIIILNRNKSHRRRLLRLLSKKSSMSFFVVLAWICFLLSILISIQYTSITIGIGMVDCSISSSSSSSRITNAFRTNIKDKNDFSIKTITGVAAAITTSTFTVSDGIAGDKIVAFQRVSTIRRMSMMSMLQSNTVASVRVQPNCYQQYRTTISLNRIRIRMFETSRNLSSSKL